MNTNTSKWNFRLDNGTVAAGALLGTGLVVAWFAAATTGIDAGSDSATTVYQDQHNGGIVVTAQRMKTAGHGGLLKTVMNRPVQVALNGINTLAQ